jgi:aspartate/methionine/tyrosine aminotransferase
MKINPFKLERIQSEWEHKVKYNLSESGVHAVSIKDLLSKEELRVLPDLNLGYSETNGTEELRDRISLFYRGANHDNILITNGSAEANFISIWSLIEPGDELVYMLPNYMQIHGIAEAFGAALKTFSLREDLNWAPDIDELKRLVTSRTKMIAVCNPNNPTGSVLSVSMMDQIVGLASKVGAWILADEIYQGAELEGPRTPTFWGRYDKVLAVAGLSKAYGIPGLRIGWIAGPKDFIASAWTYHDYSTITVGTISDFLARKALEPKLRDWLLDRNKGVLREQLKLLNAWIAKNSKILKMVQPRAGAMAYLHYDLPVNSTEFALRLIREKSVLIVPGDCFGMDSFIRIGYGAEKSRLLTGLALIKETVEEILR